MLYDILSLQPMAASTMSQGSKPVLLTFWDISINNLSNVGDPRLP